MGFWISSGSIAWHEWNIEQGHEYCSLCGERIYHSLVFGKEDIPLCQGCLKKLYINIGKIINKLEADVDV